MVDYLEILRLSSDPKNSQRLNTSSRRWMSGSPEPLWRSSTVETGSVPIPGCTDGLTRPHRYYNRGSFIFPHRQQPLLNHSPSEWFSRYK